MWMSENEDHFERLHHFVTQHTLSCLRQRRTIDKLLRGLEQRRSGSTVGTPKENIFLISRPSAKAQEGEVKRLEGLLLKCQNFRALRVPQDTGKVNEGIVDRHACPPSLWRGGRSLRTHSANRYPP
jgi:hypothetical protein